MLLFEVSKPHQATRANPSRVELDNIITGIIERQDQDRTRSSPTYPPSRPPSTIGGGIGQYRHRNEERRRQ